MPRKWLTALAVATLTAGLAGCAPAPDGEQVYREGTTPSCASCHDRGIAGAPRVNEPGDWEARAGDPEALVASVLAGRGAMPRYEDRVEREQLLLAIEYMLSTVE